MRIIMIPLLVMIAACDGKPSNPDYQIAKETVSVNKSAEVIALPGPQRDAVFLRAIRDAGLDCQGVTGSQRLASPAHPPLWRATCNNGVAYLVQVNEDGTAIVTNRIAPL